MNSQWMKTWYRAVAGEEGAEIGKAPFLNGGTFLLSRRYLVSYNEGGEQAKEINLMTSLIHMFVGGTTGKWRVERSFGTRTSSHELSACEKGSHLILPGDMLKA